MKIQGKHFVITGGGSGLGAATAEYLVQKGASVTLVDMNAEVGTQQAQALGEKAEFVQLDVTDEHFLSYMTVINPNECLPIRLF